MKTSEQVISELMKEQKNYVPDFNKINKLKKHYKVMSKQHHYIKTLPSYYRSVES